MQIDEALHYVRQTTSATERDISLLRRVVAEIEVSGKASQEQIIDHMLLLVAQGHRADSIAPMLKEAKYEAVKPKELKTSNHRIAGLAIVLFCLTAYGLTNVDYSASDREFAPQSPVQTASVKSSSAYKKPTKQWYEGGTLHSKKMADWRVASREDQLATCADFVSTIWTDKSMKPHIQSQIQTMDDIKTYAVILQNTLNESAIPEADVRGVAEMAAVAFVLLGWAK